ncbi:MAG: hypothetical protein ACK50A_03465 [Sphingobacteriaceae bacterium]
MKSKKYTYKDWWEGIVHLETCAIQHPKNASIGERLKLDDFLPKDRIKIETKQKEIFEANCEKLLQVYINEFEERYNNSEVKDRYLELELLDLDHLFNGKSETGIAFNNRDFSINNIDLFEMRRFAKTHIERGKKEYSFVHSPNYKYPIKNKVPSEEYIYAHWKYWNWLTNFAIEIKKVDGKKKGAIKPKLSVPVIALINIYSNIRITRENADEIARNYGYTSKNSGEGLFQDYTKYLKKTDRIGLSESKIKSKTKLRHINEAIKHLKGKHKMIAKEESKKLENAIEKEKEE